MELLLTVMAPYRVNVLHWHLTDNAGWRMHVPGYPMLTAIGGNIPRQPSDWYDTECAPDRKGSWRLTPAHSTQGFYSDANIHHLVNFAAARDIRIVPEISIPSHAGAAIRAYPTWETPPASIRRPMGSTIPSGPAPPLSASSKRRSITPALSSPLRPSISEEHRPTGGHGNPTSR